MNFLFNYSTVLALLVHTKLKQLPYLHDFYASMYMMTMYMYDNESFCKDFILIYITHYIVYLGLFDMFEFILYMYHMWQLNSHTKLYSNNQSSTMFTIWHRKFVHSWLPVSFLIMLLSVFVTCLAFSPAPNFIYV